MAIKRSEVLSIDHSKDIHHRIIVSALIAVVIVFLFIFVWNFFSSKLDMKEQILICGDGSFYGTCNMEKPYYCDSETGQLIEKASLCGCPNSMKKVGESCLSKYQFNPKEITLNYILRGKEKTLTFNVYGGLVNYLSSLQKKINYENGEMPLRADFKIRNINNEEQKELLLPLLIEIYNTAETKEDQVRIAVSLVQNIDFWQSNETLNLPGNNGIGYSRYPYEVLYDEAGICSEKSELLAFLLKEMGYDVAFFYYADENHEAIGIKCPVRYSVNNTGYCFIETTGPSIITDSGIEYASGIKLYSSPEVIWVSKGKELGLNMYEYDDAKKMMKLRDGEIVLFREARLNKLKEKYGLADVYYSG
jgi:hypothetical protein